jgi:translation initiation factor IF-3
MRGREQAHPDVGRKVLADMASAVGDVGRIERDVVWEGRRMTMLLAPNSTPAKGGRSGRPAPAAPERVNVAEDGQA